jgi:nucleoside-diphosphate-sugar epimerase
VVDCIAMTAADARQLLALGDRVGSVVAISSASVYRDAHGRTLDEATGEEDFPHLRVPIPESNPTVPPGDETYSTRKVAMEQTLLAGDVRATIVRPCAIHGPGTRFSREWHFVKRVLDGRRVVVLAHRGESRFHTTAAENLAELIALAARRPARRVVNCGDPNPPTVARIARTVAAALGHEWLEVLLPGEAPSEALSNPWAVPRPIVVDMATAEIDLAYRPVTTYERAAEHACRWLVEATTGKDWREVLPGSARTMSEGFDYAAEDAFLRSELTG